MTIVSAADAPMNESYSSWMLYFYVPKGTKVVGLHGGGHGEVHDSAGRPLFWLNGKELRLLQRGGPQGQMAALANPLRSRGGAVGDGADRQRAGDGEELLLPKEVVEWRIAGQQRWGQATAVSRSDCHTWQIFRRSV